MRIYIADFRELKPKFWEDRLAERREGNNRQEAADIAGRKYQGLLISHC